MYIWYKNFSYSVIYLPTIIKIDGHLTKFWQKQFVQFILRHGVHVGYYDLLILICMVLGFFNEE